MSASAVDTLKFKKNNMYAVKSMVPYLWPEGRLGIKARVVIAGLCLLLSKVTAVLMPLYYKKTVDAMESSVDPVILVPVSLILAYGIFRIISALFGEIRDIVFENVAQGARREIALEVFNYLHKLSLKFHLERKTGGLSRSIERGTRGMEFVLRFMMFNILPTLFEILFVCLFLAYLYDIEFSLITFVVIVLYIFFTIVFTEWRVKFRRRMNNEDSVANTKAMDSLLNYETVKYFSKEDHENRRYDESLGRYYEAAIKSQQTLGVLNMGQYIVIAVGLVVMMLLAAKQVAAGTMTIGDFVLLNTYLLQLYTPVSALGWIYREIKHSLIDMEDMFTLLEVNKEIEDKPGAVALSVSGGSVAFENVEFAYDERRQVINDISFTVPAGKMVAVVGSSGAGKSTLSRLLFRFYDVTGGTIKVDGQDIRDVTQESLRESIGIVPQDTVLFNDTIAYNIGYGAHDCSREDVIKAAKMAHIHEFISSLPDGYDTLVGERGLKLSGGEKQRVAIARMILKRPDIYVFDEATSALDSKTEKDIQASLQELSAGVTTLVIAHRLSTVVESDEILVLDHGRIVERGSHEELLAAGGKYNDMWERQQHSTNDSSSSSSPSASSTSTLGEPYDA